MKNSILLVPVVLLMVYFSARGLNASIDRSSGRSPALESIPKTVCAAYEAQFKETCTKKRGF